MKWSWRVGRVAGVTVYLHATLLILIAWVGYEYYAWRHQAGDVVEAVFFVASFFAIVLLHELGHAVAARRYGIRTRDITLMPIGGLARMESLPEKPYQELIVALAGPAVNFLLAALYWGTVSPISELALLNNLSWGGGHFLHKLAWANLAMGVFNLVPAFPMDGGRVLRALLAMRWGPKRATQTAVDVGQALAFAFGAVGLYAMNPIWVFIALFVFVGADQELELVKMRSVLSGVPIQRVMITDLRTLAPQDSLQRAIDHTLAGFHQDFPVVEHGQVIGVLTRRSLMTALARRGQSTSVRDVMQREFQTAHPSEQADAVFGRLQTADCRSLPVLDHTRLVGIVTAENLGEFLMIQSALTGKRKAGAGA